MAADALIGLAMSAIFNFCVPAVSDGARAQTFPADMLQPLSAAEAVDLIGEDQFGGRHSRVKTDEGILVVSQEGAYCRVIGGSGNSGAALTAFRAALQEAGGREGFPFDTQGATPIRTDGWIPVNDRRSIVLVFTISDEDAQGFFASAFLVEKDGS